MKALLTGSQGFIGLLVRKALKQSGVVVVGVDRKEGNLVKDIKAGEYDVIIHTAGNLFDNFEENYESTKHLVEAFPNTKIIFTSSAAVYGDNPFAQEEDSINPYGEYGGTKSREEQLILRNPKNIIFRLSNVFGNTSDHGVIAAFLAGKKTIYNSGNTVRDFVPVETVVRAIVYAVKNPSMSGIYNVSSGSARTIKQLFYRLGLKRPEYMSGKNEIGVSVLDNSKLIRRMFK